MEFLNDLATNCIMEFDNRKYMNYRNVSYNPEQYPGPVECKKVSVNGNTVVFNIGPLEQATFFPRAFSLKYNDEINQLILFNVDRDDIHSNILRAAQHCHKLLKSELYSCFNNNEFNMKLKWKNKVYSEIESTMNLIIAMSQSSIPYAKTDALLEIKFERYIESCCIM